VTGALADARRLVSSAALYAAAGLAQRGVGFLLIPVYTRVIEPADYGVLEVLNAFSAVFFAVLTLGLASAINKCYHRDCRTEADRRRLLGTALLLDLPVLLAGAALLVWFAGPASRLLVGHGGAESLMPLVAASAVTYSVGTLVFATLRAQERAAAFGVLTLAQFVAALGLNVLFVVGWGWGVHGVLLGNLLSQALALPLALRVVGGARRFAIDRRLARALLEFGLFLVPVMLAGWVMDQSDRYLLGRLRSLEEVALYGVGYKFGGIVDLLVVWPFQLAWPAFSFAISDRAGHRETYARTLTYFTLLLAAAVVAVSIFARGGLGLLVGERYAGARVVVPLVALAYALNGVHYCVSPGVHLARRTRVLPWIAAVAALVNVGLNLLLIPAWGMLGAAWATVAAFLVLAGGTTIVAQRSYPVPWEYGRLGRVLGVGAAVYLLSGAVHAGGGVLVLALELAGLAVAFPLLLALTGFFDATERAAVARTIGRARARLGVPVWPVR
jgi:O-antigen/teichoic acid export membrane protein